MKKTTASEVIRFFESSFADKREIPYELEMVWLKKAIGRYGNELAPLSFDDEVLEFDTELDAYVIDTLAAIMKESYQERQVSLVNKRISIASKDLSIDGSGGTKAAEETHLNYVKKKVSEMIASLKPMADTQ